MILFKGVPFTKNLISLFFVIVSIILIHLEYNEITISKKLKLNNIKLNNIKLKRIGINVKGNETIKVNLCDFNLKYFIKNKLNITNNITNNITKSIIYNNYVNITYLNEITKLCKWIYKNQNNNEYYECFIRKHSYRNIHKGIKLIGTLKNCEILR